jgi:hypothetical protein
VTKSTSIRDRGREVGKSHRGKRRPRTREKLEELATQHIGGSANHALGLAALRGGGKT